LNVFFLDSGKAIFFIVFWHEVRTGHERNLIANHDSVLGLCHPNADFAPCVAQAQILLLSRPNGELFSLVYDDMDVAKEQI
jgi:hypothetical protein